MSDSPARAAAPPPADRGRTFGCMALIVAPFALSGAGLILYGLSGATGAPDNAMASVMAGVAALIGGVFAAIIFAPLLRGRSTRPDRRHAHPTEPWRWREDWAAGVVEARPTGVAAFLALARFHDVRLTLAVAPVAVGRECAGRIEIADGATHLDFSRPLTCVLTCVHRRARGSGKSRSVSEIEHWREEQSLPLEPYGTGARVAWKAGIPADRPATTLDALDDRVRWDLRIQQEIGGADLDFTFELPVFRVDDSVLAASAGAGMVAALGVTPPLAPVPPSAQSGVQVTLEGGGVQVAVAPGRHAQFNWLLLGLALVFAAGAAVQIAAGAWVGAMLAGLIALPLLYGVLRLRYRRVDVEATADLLRVRTRLLGAGTERELAASAVRELQMVVGMTVGPIPYWDVRATPVTGSAFTLVPSMEDEAAAKFVTGALAAVLQVPVAPPDRRLPSDSAAR